VRKKIENDQRKAEGKGTSSNSLMSMTAIHKEIEEDDNSFIAGQVHLQEQKIAEQNEKLAELGRAVDGLGVGAKNINTEVKIQGRMLDDLGNSMNDAGDKMNAVMASLSKLYKRL
jgi:hypothetical protein